MIETSFGDTTLQILRGHLAERDVDAVVRETDVWLEEEFAPGDLLEAGGAALREAVEEARRELGEEGLNPGEVVATDAGELDADIVVHTTLPPWQGRYHGEKIDLEWSYHHSIVAAIDRKLTAIAFPPLGLDERGFPGYEATVIALNTVERVVTFKDRRTDYRGAIDRVELVLSTDEEYELYERVFDAYAHRWEVPA